MILVRSSLVVPVVPDPDVSDAVARSTLVAAVIVVSIVMVSDDDTLLVFPAASSDCAVRVWMPSDSVDEVIDHAPVEPAAPEAMLPAVVAVPRTVEPSVS